MYISVFLYVICTGVFALPGKEFQHGRGRKMSENYCSECHSNVRVDMEEHDSLRARFEKTDESLKELQNQVVFELEKAVRGLKGMSDNLRKMAKGLENGDKQKEEITDK